MASSLEQTARTARKHNPWQSPYLTQGDDRNQESAARGLIRPLVTDMDSPIYCPTDRLDSATAGLIAARFSRSPLTMTQMLYREFRPPENKSSHASVANYTQEFARRVINEYGDDSVRELASTHIYFHGVSQIAAKLLEHSRISNSPLEKSTRYVSFADKNFRGDYNFWREPELMYSPYRNLYLNTTRQAFDTYASVLPKLDNYFRTTQPIENQFFQDGKTDKKVKYSELSSRGTKIARRAYEQSIKAQAMDVARSLLPASALTNLGLHGNTRALSYLMTKLMASPFAEGQMIAYEATTQLRQTLIPEFWSDIDNHHGQSQVQFLHNQSQQLSGLATDILRDIEPQTSPDVELVECNDPELLIAAGCLYPYSNLPFSEIIEILSHQPDQIIPILQTAIANRTNRRHKPPRAYELVPGNLTFDFLADFGAFRDLQRHRIGTLEHQAYTAEHGYTISPVFEEVGLLPQVQQTFDAMGEAHQRVKSEHPSSSQYLTMLGHNMRWYFSSNLRENFWLTELRTTPQAHPSYRSLAQQMHRLAIARYPFLSDLDPSSQTFVNLETSDKLVRLDAAMKTLTQNEE